MLRAVRRSDASGRTVVLPDPMEPVISSAVIGGIGDLVFGTGHFRSVVPPGLESLVCCVPRTSSWAKFFAVPFGTHEPFLAALRAGTL